MTVELKLQLLGNLMFVEVGIFLTFSRKKQVRKPATPNLTTDMEVSRPQLVSVDVYGTLMLLSWRYV